MSSQNLEDVHRPDMAWIDHDRRPEVERRIRAIKKFVENPGRKSADAHAAELGITPQMFYRLAQIWQRHQRPELLDGLRRPKTATAT